MPRIEEEAVEEDELGIELKKPAEQVTRVSPGD